MAGPAGRLMRSVLESAQPSLQKSSFRFLAGEAIVARPSGKVLKLWRKIRPKPARRSPLTDP